MSGQLLITLLFNVLLANGISVYLLAFVLKADIVSMCYKNDATYYNFWETTTCVFVAIQ